MLKKISNLVIISIILLTVLLFTTNVFADVNLALGKPAQQAKEVFLMHTGLFIPMW